MSALEELMADRARAAQARFFLRAGRAKGLKCGDGVSGELFGLPMILEADGLLRRAPERAEWRVSYRADAAARVLADRHYNRQKVGAPQFVPPGACYVLLSACKRAVWVTSWPKAEYVQHAWGGAWVNSLFRREGGARASELIRLAIAHTRANWPTPPQGMVSFVDPRHVPPVKRRLPPARQHRHVFEQEGRTEVYGYCYLKAGFGHVGYTKGGLWAWLLLPLNMPAARELAT